MNFLGRVLQRLTIDPNQSQVLQSIASLQSPISYVHSCDWYQLFVRQGPGQPYVISIVRSLNKTFLTLVQEMPNWILQINIFSPSRQVHPTSQPILDVSMTRWGTSNPTSPASLRPTSPSLSTCSCPHPSQVPPASSTSPLHRAPAAWVPTGAPISPAAQEEAAEVVRGGVGTKAHSILVSSSIITQLAMDMASRVVPVAVRTCHSTTSLWTAPRTVR